jgi:hypothetical protein
MPLRAWLIILVFVKELFLHDTLDTNTKNDNRLVDIEASSPYRADFINAIGAALSFESSSKDVSECTLLYQIKGAMI